MVVGCYIILYIEKHISLGCPVAPAVLRGFQLISW